MLVKYETVWRYLLRLRRVGAMLEGAWGVMRRQAAAHRADPGFHASRLPLWQLRAHMAHFVGNLQIYLQVPQLLCAPLQLALLCLRGWCAAADHHCMLRHPGPVPATSTA